ncbi:MAG: putative sulfate exporter family transporter [Rikenellaceae bacterium]
MKKFFEQFKSEDWVIVFAGSIVMLLAFLFPESIPSMPKSLATSENWISAFGVYLFLLIITVACNIALKRSVRGVVGSLFVITAMSMIGQVIANIPVVKEFGFEAVFFSVILGLLVSNLWRVPEWLRPAIQSEFYIKIGIVCMGSTILFGDVLQSGIYGLLQSLVVVFVVWNFTFWLSRRMGIDREMGTMLSSSVSICGVSAAIATCGVIQGDNKKLSYVISLVLVCAIPMMYVMPWLSELMGLNEEVAGAWLGGTIDTTGAVAASGTMLGETAAKTAIIVKSSQNVLLGVAAFFISLMWSYKGKRASSRPTVGVLWDRFPKFVVGFVLMSLFFSFCLDADVAKSVGKIGKGMTTTLFSIAFVCIGLETRFSELFSRENKRPMVAFLTAQGFNVLVTLVVAYVIFGVIKPYFLSL